MSPTPQPPLHDHGHGEGEHDTDLAVQPALGRVARAVDVARRARAGAYLAVREGLTLAAVLVVVVGVAAAFPWPWLPSPPIGGSFLATYAPLYDGDARLLLRTS